MQTMTTADGPNHWLADEEQFSSFVTRITGRLLARRQHGLLFLKRAGAEVQLLRREAEPRGGDEARGDVAAGLERACEDLRRLQQSVAASHETTAVPADPPRSDEAAEVVQHQGPETE